MNRAPTPLLRFENVSRRFGPVTALDRVTLDVRAGEIHALLGENGAGKSTLMHVAAGLEQPDAGELWIDGQPREIDSPRAAATLGIGLVSQHFALAPALSAEENYELVCRAGRRLYRRRDLEHRLERDGRVHGLRIPSRRPVGELAVGDQQRLEILKALGTESRILILDEPTAALTAHEFEELASVLRRWRKTGRAVVFISHKLEEVLALADRITVLRRGAVVGERIPGDTDATELARLMIGETLPPPLERTQSKPGPVRLRIENLRAERDVGPPLEIPSLTIRGGEIFGVAGIDGNGQQELFQVITGERQSEAGLLEMDGEDRLQADVSQRAARGLGAIPADRHRHGLILAMSVAENLWLRGIPGDRRDLRPRWLRWLPGTLSRRRLVEAAAPVLAEFGIRGEAAAPVSELSGGNQQKVVLARELSREPGVLVAHNPTRGVDVLGARFIHEKLLDHRARGSAIVLISTDLDELLRLSDRLAVLVAGRWRELPPEDRDRDVLGRALGGRLSGGGDG